MDLPGQGEIPGGWDLRPNVDSYLGKQDFQGKRCLDLGAASGFLSFEMERRGAREVVSFDLDDLHHRELVSFGDPPAELAETLEQFAQRLAGIQRSYWYAHRLLGSQVRMCYGNVYRLPPELGSFDHVMLGMILPHLRDPFLALEQAVARCERGGVVVVTQQAPAMDGAWAYFMPDPATRRPYAAWWSMSEDCLRRMLMCLGCVVEQSYRERYLCPARSDGLDVTDEECLTVVARRN